MKPCCEKCIFFDPFDQHGECHRFPPIPMISNHTFHFTFVFPITDNNDWCGEFKPKNSLPESKEKL